MPRTRGNFCSTSGFFWNIFVMDAMEIFNADDLDGMKEQLQWTIKNQGEWSAFGCFVLLIGFMLPEHWLSIGS